MKLGILTVFWANKDYETSFLVPDYYLDRFSENMSESDCLAFTYFDCPLFDCSDHVDFIGPEPADKMSRFIRLESIRDVSILRIPYLSYDIKDKTIFCNDP